MHFVKLKMCEKDWKECLLQAIVVFVLQPTKETLQLICINLVFGTHHCHLGF